MPAFVSPVAHINQASAEWCLAQSPPGDGVAVRSRTTGREVARYWPGDLLSAFTLQMAAQGCCVNTSMMLGDHGYAVEKLSQAHSFGDADLRELAVRMFAYFETPARASFGRLDLFSDGAQMGSGRLRAS